LDIIRKILKNNTSTLAHTKIDETIILESDVFIINKVWEKTINSKIKKFKYFIIVTYGDEPESSGLFFE